VLFVATPWIYHSALRAFGITAVHLGHITKQGSSILRFLLVEALRVTVRSVLPV
jgi:hypothetical protein